MIVYIYIYINFVCHLQKCQYISIYQKWDIYFWTSYVSVSSKHSKTQWNNENCKKYKFEN